MATRGGRKFGIGLGGFLATAVFHVLLLQTLFLGSGQRTFHRPDVFGDGATAFGAKLPAESTLVLIDVPSSVDPADQDPQEVTSAGVEVDTARVLIAALNALPPSPFLSEPDGAALPATADLDGEAAQRAELAGRYQGQIKARIERAWLRPRDPVPGDLFHCTVKILQDQKGYVREVDLVSCGGTPRWQSSLATAIQAASPLPAPPDPSVYSDALTLAFSAPTYQDGSDEQGYEDVRQGASAQSAGLPPIAAEALSPHMPSETVASDTVTLTIVGSQMQWSSTSTTLK